ncbi:hypothetical protein DI09_2p90 [Mitosporidium daphniae]|uniref:Uncharacterized protein n=1 Tax=Mitosporidium daphniae TaxID=1485682 RepID=A0A098VRH3_9MICR|nr:uncharacterized protein DI09_2p90 [Mitosporidium daphniae]KGG51632.1 hypothetical protein DI09_2p90 [Mitosporidium daphniae]|eukprot:XP_013238115.1 uncharacterized protein DI09_2p90 [Mitosporidium daphniae]
MYQKLQPRVSPVYFYQANLLRSLRFIDVGGCLSTLHYYCISLSTKEISNSASFLEPSRSDALLNLDPLTLDETLNWVEQVFQSSNISQDGLLPPSKEVFPSTSSTQLGSSFPFAPPLSGGTSELQMSFFQKTLYKTAIAYKVSRCKSRKAAKLNLITTLPMNFIRMLYRIVFLKAIKYEFPASSVPVVESESALNSVKSLRKALEIDIPIRRNMTELQNMMGDFADAVDQLLCTLAYYMLEEDLAHIILRWMILIFAFISFYMTSNFLSTNALFATAGTALLAYCHPWIRCFVSSFLMVTMDYMYTTNSHPHI